MTSAWRCRATQPGRPSSNAIRRCGYVEAKRSSENPRGSSVRVVSSATQSPTAGASISSAAARAISRRTRSRSSDAAMTLDRRASPWSRARRRSAPAFSSRRRRSSISGASPLTGSPGWMAQNARAVHPKCRHWHWSASSLARAQAAQQWARSGSTRQLHAGFAQPPAVASGAAAMPPGNFGTVGVATLTAVFRHCGCRPTAEG